MTKIDDAVAAAMKIPGWMSQSELTWLAERAAELPERGVWLDIGIMAGRSWTCIARAMPEKALLAALDTSINGCYYSRDNYTGDWATDWPVAWSWCDSLRLIERRNFRWLTAQGRAEECAHLFADGSLDVVFIDACHTYEGTKAQMELYRAKLKPGGLLCGHDYCDTFLGVIQAVDELHPERQLVPGGSLWAIRL